MGDRLNFIVFSPKSSDPPLQAINNDRSLRGLRNTHKRGAIFSHLKKQKATIFNLQETFSKPEDEKIWTAESGGKVFSPMARIIRRESQC